MKVSPNPFTTQVGIEYNLAMPAMVKLSICDIAGNKIKVLVSGTKNAGYYRVQWDGRDDSNKLLPAGIYFARFIVGNSKETKKLILAR